MEVDVFTDVIPLTCEQISGREGPPGQPCAECRAVVCTSCGGYGSSNYDKVRTDFGSLHCIIRLIPPDVKKKRKTALAPQNEQLSQRRRLGLTGHPADSRTLLNMDAGFFSRFFLHKRIMCLLNYPIFDSMRLSSIRRLQLAPPFARNPTKKK